MQKLKIPLLDRLTKKQKYVIAFVLTIAISVGLFFFQDKLIELKGFGLIGLFIISIISGMLFFPSPVLIAAVLAAGRTYNPFLVAIIASLGSTIGDILGYGLGYTGREAFVDSKKLRNVIIQDLFLKFGGLFTFIFALIPNPFFDAIGTVAGLFEYPLKKFLIYVFSGRLIRNLLLAYLGSAL